MLTSKVRNTKLFQMISKAQSMKSEMEELEKNEAVKRYFELDSARRKLHGEISDHVTQYKVNVEDYKPAGLVERENRWVTVGDVEKLAKEEPSLRDKIMNVIQRKTSHYTRRV